MVKKKKTKTIGVCGVKVPFVYGGAEILCAGLVRRLNEAGYRAELIEAPFGWWPAESILPNAAAWRMMEFTDPAGKPFDLLITTKFPSYLIKHPNKVAWLFHQMRELYDYEIKGGGVFNESLKDNRIREKLIELDRAALREHKEIFTISGNVGKRLKKYCGLSSKVLYPPPKLIGRYYSSGYGDYLLYVGRLDPWKRVDLLIESLSRCRSSARAVVVGKGDEDKRIRAAVKKYKLQDRVKFYSDISDEKLLELYAGARAVYFCPKDEDYGFITVEAFFSHKPVITAVDSGGPTEFVENGVTGFVVQPTVEDIASAIDKLFGDDTLAKEMGAKAGNNLKHLTWDTVLDRLCGNI